MKNTTKASLLYLCLLTLSVSSDVKTNPGPDYPCGSCGREVSDDDQVIDCDSCHTWFHIQCKGIRDDTYKNLLNKTSFSWNCITCDHINFSHSSKSFSLASGNSFSILSDSSESDRSHCKSLSYSKPDAAYDRTSSMKILNINCQSIINKRSEFQSVLDLEKPDLVIGTESWLNTDHLDSEIFPRSLGYTSFRRDRASGTKGGGVFILVEDTLVASWQKTLETHCEVIWVTIEAAQSKPVYLTAYYRPHENDFHSFEEFCRSVDMVSKKNGHIWILRDLSYPKFHWNDNHVPQVKQGCSFPQQYDDFINLLDDNNLIQMVSEPTRQDNTLDLFLTNNDSPVSKVS